MGQVASALVKLDGAEDESQLEELAKHASDDAVRERIASAKGKLESERVMGGRALPFRCSGVAHLRLLRFFGDNAGQDVSMRRTRGCDECEMGVCRAS